MPWLDLERRNSPENPQTSLSNPAAWLVNALGAAGTSAGVSVSEQKALNVGAWHQALDIVAKGVACVPLITHRRTQKGRERATDLRVYHVLHTRPNPEMTAFQFHHTMAGFWAGWGNAYAEIEWRRDGEVMWLWPLLPTDCRVIRTGAVTPAQARVGIRPRTKYVAVRLDPSTPPPEDLPVVNGEAWLPPGKYIHVPGLSIDGLAGLRPAVAAKQTLGRSLAMAEHEALYYGQGAQLPTIVQPKEGFQMPEPARKRLAEKLRPQLGGLSQAHRIAVVEAGLDFHTVGVDPQRSQLIEGLQNGVLEIARYFDIPPYRLGAGEKQGQSYASVEAKQLDLAQWTHLPTLMRFEQAYTWELMPDRTEPMEARSLFAEFLWENMLRADSKVRAEVEGIRLRNGQVTINETRAWNNMNGRDEPEADQLFMEINRAPISMVSGAFGGNDSDGNGSDDDEPDPVGDRAAGVEFVEKRRALVNFRQLLIRAQRPLWLRAGEQLVAKEVRALRRILTRARSAENPVERMLDLMAEFYEGFEPEVARAIAPILSALVPQLVQSITQETGRAISEDQADRMIRDYADTAGARHVGSSRGQISQLVERISERLKDESPADQASAILEAVEERLDEWQEKRPGKIADGDSTRSAGALSRSLYAAAGVRFLIWAGGDCPLCSQLNGRVVGVEEPFLGKGDTLSPEGASPLTTSHSISHPPLHPPSCDCVIISGG